MCVIASEDRSSPIAFFHARIEFGVHTLTERITKTVQIEVKKMEIEEQGIRLRLTIVDTPGFNDSLNGEERYAMFHSSF